MLYTFQILHLIGCSQDQPFCFSIRCQRLYKLISSAERLMGDSLSLSPHWKRWGPLCLAASPLLSWLTEQREVSTLDFYPLYASQMKYNVTQNAWIWKEQICVSVVWFGSLGNLPRRGRGWKTAGPSWSCGANSRLRESSTDTGPGSTEQVFLGLTCRVWHVMEKEEISISL